MIVPKEGPLGVELLRHEDGAFLTVEEEAPFWMFWKTMRRCTVLLDRFGMIWLYQAVAKMMRRQVTEPGFDELANDLRSSLTVFDSVFSTSISQETLEKVAMTMRAKGWVKM